MERWSQSAWHRSVYLAAAIVALGLTLGVGAHSRAAFAAVCVGDCNGDGKVTIDEGITVAAINVGNQPVSACSAGVVGTTIAIDQVVKAASNEISGCGGGGAPVCGNGVVDAGEDCDIGGTCIGNANAGMHCTSDTDCGGSGVGGVCEGGDKRGAQCASLSDCPNGKCVRCKVFEGPVPGTNNSCAANCTFETPLVFNLKPGQPDPVTLIAAGTSGAVVHGEVLSLPLPIGDGCVGGTNAGKPCTGASDCPGGACEPATQTFGVGKDRGDGVLPLVIKSASVRFPQIDVGGLACACVRGVSQKSCGGTIFQPDGTTETPFCTANFGICNTSGKCSQLTSVSCTKNTDCEGPAFCTAAHLNPCTFVHGDGNSASGNAGCTDAGLNGVNYLFTQDAGGCADPPACTMRNTKPPSIAFSGTGPKGSAILLNTTAIGTAIGSCSGTDVTIYGPDGEICTDDDPQASRGTPATIPLTTGMASSEVFHANFSQPGAGDVTICDMGTTGTECNPYTTTGMPFTCTALEMGQPPGGGLVSAFVSLAQPTIMDIAVVSQFFAQ